MRKSYGIGNVIKLLRDKNFKEHWGIVKAAVGLIKNLAISTTLIPYLCEQNALRRLIELMNVVDRERARTSEDNVQFQQQVDSLLDTIIGALINMTKDASCRSMMRDMNCSAILMRVSQARVTKECIDGTSSTSLFS